MSRPHCPQILEDAGIEGADVEPAEEDTVNADAEPDIEKDPEDIRLSTDARVPEPHEDHDHVASQLNEAMKRGACMLSRRRVALEQHIPGGDNQLSLVQLWEDEVTFVKWHFSASRPRTTRAFGSVQPCHLSNALAWHVACAASL